MLKRMESSAANNNVALQWAKEACDSLMVRYKTAAELPPAHKWHYHQGVFLYGMLKLWEQNGDDRYLVYVKSYVDAMIDEYGNFYFERDQLDAIMPGLLLFALDEHFEDSRYRIAAEKLRALFHTINRTSEGGFWHKDKYPYQMWLDGLYMGGVFACMYGTRFGEPQLLDMALNQERLMRAYMKDERTGLLYHAWDETRTMSWADPKTGCSPEFWGRSLGWYGMALVDFLDMLPKDHSGRAAVEQATASLIEALLSYQDPKSGLWYQVVDKGDQEDNWLESSCTSLFIYTIAKAIKHRVVPESYKEQAIKAFDGLLASFRSDSSGLIVTGICIGTSAGDYVNYVTRPTSENDLHGVGAFVLASVEMEPLLQAQED